MKRFVVTVCLALITAGRLFAADWSDTVKNVGNSVVWAQVGEQGGCTAFVINQKEHLLLTAAHCKPDHGEILWVDHVPSSVKYLDPKRDIMVVVAPDLDPARPAVRFASKNPVIGEEVMSVGYGFALERPFFRQAHVQDDKMALSGVEGGPFISTDSPFVGGQSGGPVVNQAGEVVSIVQRGDNGTTGLGIGVETIRSLVERFFEGKK